MNICRCVPMSFVNGVGTDVLYCDKELGQRGGQSEASCLQGRLRYFFKCVFWTKPNTFSADNTFFFIDHRQSVDIPLGNGAFGTNRDRRARMVLRTFLRIYDNFHVAALLSDLQYCSLMDSIRAMTRSSWIQYITFIPCFSEARIPAVLS